MSETTQETPEEREARENTERVAKEREEQQRRDHEISERPNVEAPAQDNGAPQNVPPSDETPA